MRKVERQNNMRWRGRNRREIDRRRREIDRRRNIRRCLLYMLFGGVCEVPTTTLIVPVPSLIMLLETRGAVCRLNSSPTFSSCRSRRNCIISRVLINIRAVPDDVIILSNLKQTIVLPFLFHSTHFFQRVRDKCSTLTQ